MAGIGYQTLAGDGYIKDGWSWLTEIGWSRLHHDGWNRLFKMAGAHYDNSCYLFSSFRLLLQGQVQKQESRLKLPGAKSTKSQSYSVICLRSVLSVFQGLNTDNIGAPQIEAVVDKMKEYGFIIEDILDYQRTPENLLFQLDLLFKNSYIY